VAADGLAAVDRGGDPVGREGPVLAEAGQIGVI